MNMTADLNRRFFIKPSSAICPKCGSDNVHETVMVWTPEGVKAYRCSSCYHTWWDHPVPRGKGENIVGWKLPITKCPECEHDLKIWIDLGFKTMADPDSICARIIEIEPCPKCGYDEYDVKLPKVLKQERGNS